MNNYHMKLKYFWLLISLFVFYSGQGFSTPRDINSGENYCKDIAAKLNCNFKEYYLTENRLTNENFDDLMMECGIRVESADEENAVLSPNDIEKYLDNELCEDSGALDTDPIGGGDTGPGRADDCESEPSPPGGGDTGLGRGDQCDDSEGLYL